MRIWIGNMAPDTADDEIRAFFKKYAHNLECTEIERVEGSGKHPGAMLKFSGGTPADLGNLALRINGMYWKGRPVYCSTMVR